MNEICLSCKKHTKCGRAKVETIGCGYYVPMTNEEWFCSLPTEEKAKELQLIYLEGRQDGFYDKETDKQKRVKDFYNWLKAVHEE